VDDWATLSGASALRREYGWESDGHDIEKTHKPRLRRNKSMVGIIAP